eukprot:scaffold31893_cov129-Isochrysis_galbana.AAC.4
MMDHPMRYCAQVLLAASMQHSPETLRLFAAAAAESGFDGVLISPSEQHPGFASDEVHIIRLRRARGRGRRANTAAAKQSNRRCVAFARAGDASIHERPRSPEKRAQQQAAEPMAEEHPWETEEAEGERQPSRPLARGGTASRDKKKRRGASNR